MKRTIVLTAFVFIASITFAQGSLSKGSNQLNFGLGLSGWGVPVYIGLDHGLDKDFSLGGELSYRNYHDNYFGYKYHHNIIGVSANGNYHFNRILEIPRDFDFYAGLNLGFYFWSSSSDYHGSGESGLGLGAQVGGRYYFNNKIGLNLEFGGGNAFSGGKIGLTVKL
jgi:outer membrane immunogenic protein